MAKAVDHRATELKIVALLSFIIIPDQNAVVILKLVLLLVHVYMPGQSCVVLPKLVAL